MQRAAISQGQLRWVVPFDGGEKQPAYLLNVISNNGGVEILLAHPYEEFATATDLVVPSAASQLPFALVIQSTIRGVAFTQQIGDLIGLLDPTIMENLACVMRNQEFTDTFCYRGLSLRGPMDSRWNFKIGQAKILNDLTSEFLSSLNSPNKVHSAVLDSAMFDFEFLKSLDDPREAIHRVVQIHGEGAAQLGAEQQLAMNEKGFFNLDNWRTQLGKSTEDLYNLFVMQMINIPTNHADFEDFIEVTSSDRINSTKSFFITSSGEILTFPSLWKSENIEVTALDTNGNIILIKKQQLMNA